MRSREKVKWTEEIGEVVRKFDWGTSFSSNLFKTLKPKVID
jgi:hypothetical protein